jgi:hypothetical protein
MVSVPLVPMACRALSRRFVHTWFSCAHDRDAGADLGAEHRQRVGDPDPHVDLLAGGLVEVGVAAERVDDVGDPLDALQHPAHAVSDVGTGHHEPEHDLHSDVVEACQRIGEVGRPDASSDEAVGQQRPVGEVVRREDRLHVTGQVGRLE